VWCPQNFPEFQNLQNSFQTARVSVIVVGMLWFLGGCRNRPLEINPQDAVAWYNEGTEMGKLGRWEEALKRYDRALEINPQGAEAWVGKGWTLGNLDRAEEAL